MEDSSFLAYANNVLINYADAILPSKYYYIIGDLNSYP
jgi:hypothetical protein